MSLWLQVPETKITAARQPMTARLLRDFGVSIEVINGMHRGQRLGLIRELVRACPSPHAAAAAAAASPAAAAPAAAAAAAPAAGSAGASVGGRGGGNEEDALQEEAHEATAEEEEERRARQAAAAAAAAAAVLSATPEAGPGRYSRHGTARHDFLRISDHRVLS